MIRAKYAKENNWITKKVTTPYGVSLWRSLRSGGMKLKATLFHYGALLKHDHMENSPQCYMVGYLEREEFKMF